MKYYNNYNKVMNELESKKYVLNNFNLVFKKIIRFYGIVDGVKTFKKNFCNEYNVVIICKYTSNCKVYVMNKENNRLIGIFEINPNSLFNNVKSNGFNTYCCRNRFCGVYKQMKNCINMSIGKVYNDFKKKHNEFIDNLNGKLFITPLLDSYKSINLNKMTIKRINKYHTLTNDKHRILNTNYIIGIDFENCDDTNKYHIINKMFKVLRNDYFKTLINDKKELYKYNSKYYFGKSIQYSNTKIDCVVCYNETNYKSICCNNSICNKCYYQMKKCPMCRCIYYEKDRMTKIIYDENFNQKIF